MTLQLLFGLDWTSAQFPDQLDHLLRGGHVESIQALPDGELVEVVNYLDDVLEQLDHTGQPFRKCLQVLQEICGVWGILPASYQISGALPFTSEHPVAFGGFGDIFEGKVGTSTNTCIKKIRICTTDNADELKQSFCREAAVWKHLSHPNIVPFLGVTFEPLQLVSEWMPGGELREYVKSHPGADLMNLLLGVAEGLAYLHSCDVIHGDFKGPNIMVDESGTARITDFGLATLAQSPDSHGSIPDIDCHTARWCAPELFLGDQPASKESDVFSFGMVVIEVFTGKAPFGEYKTTEVITKIVLGTIPGRPSHVNFTDALWELTQQCLKREPSDRPSAEQVLAALKNIDSSREVSHGRVGAPGGRNDTS